MSPINVSVLHFYLTLVDLYRLCRRQIARVSEEDRRGIACVGGRIHHAALRDSSV